MSNNVADAPIPVLVFDLSKPAEVAAHNAAISVLTPVGEEQK